MARPTSPLSILLLLLLFGLTLISASGSSYEDSQEEDMNNDIPLIPSEKRASNLGSRLDSRNCGAFNLGKKFIGYQWLRSMESRQRRTPYLISNYRPHESPRDNDMYWVKSYRY